MSVLICGSIAYDTIMVFHSKFKNHILPEQLHILNVAFLVPEMRREFGGCAGNIAYSLKLLGGHPEIMATVGQDADSYFTRLDKLKISCRFVHKVPDVFTAQAFITTDEDNNQITAFHPGAMNFSHQNHISDTQDISLGIVSPDGRDGMLQHAQEFAEAKIPFIFDPGQGLPMFNGPELIKFIEMATWCTLNDYEAQMICEKTDKSLEELAQNLKGLIVTRGAEGSRLYENNKIIDIPCAREDSVQDPTGCGDAYRGGLLYALTQGWNLEKAAQLASVMGAFKIACQGAQNYSVSRDDIAARYAESYGEQPW